MPLSKYFGGMDEGNYTVAINKIIDALNAVNAISAYASFSRSEEHTSELQSH